MNEELEREVFVMCNLSQGVKAEGINIGEMRMLVQLVRDGDLKIERAAEKAKMTMEQFKKMMENTPLGRSRAFLMPKRRWLRKWHPECDSCQDR